MAKPMSKKSDDNLIGKSMADISKAEHLRRSALGGTHAGVKRHKLRAAKEYMRELIALPPDKSQKDIVKYFNDANIPEADQNQLSILLVALMKRAQEGDVKCAELVLALMGEKPSDKLEVGGTLTVAGVMAELRERQERVKREQDDG